MKKLFWLLVLLLLAPNVYADPLARKIADLPNGAPSQTGDVVPIQRGASGTTSYKLRVGQLIPKVTAFPGAPTTGEVVIVTDDSAAGACDSSGGTALSLCYYNGSGWVKLGDGTGGSGSLSAADIDTSAEIRAIVTDETGTGFLVFATGPTIDAPIITSKFNFPHVTAFPGSPSAGDVVVVTDDSAAGACDSAAGSAVSLCYYNGSGWVKLGDGTGAGGSLSASDIDTSAEIRAIVGDETGTGPLVFAGGNIGAATATSVNGLTITSSTGTLTITNGKTAAISNSLTFTGTDSSSVAFGTGGTVVYTSNNLGALASTTSAQLATVLSDETGSGGGFVRATAPTIDSPVITTKINIPRVTAFPGTPSAGDTVIVTDDSAAGACDSAAGSATTLCQYNGSAWVKLGDGTGAGGSLTSSDIDTSAEIRAIVGDETGTGALVFAGGNIGAATASTPSANDNTTAVATTAYVQTELTAYASDTKTLTNTTYDTAGTGNSFSINGVAATANTGTGSVVRATAPTVDSPVITSKINIPSVTAFPGSPSPGDVVIVTDDSAVGACDSAAGSAVSLCRWNGSAWAKLGDGTGAGGSLTSSDIDTSAEIRAIVGDETGTGALVFAGGNIGAATATSVNGLTITSSTGTLTITNGKTAAISNSLTFTGTDSSSVAFGAGGTVVYTSNNLGALASTTSAQLATVLSDETGSGGGFVRATSPQLTTPDIGSATASNVTMANGGGLRTSTSAGNTLKIQAYDVDGTAYTDFVTCTANNTPTCDLSTSVTVGGNTLAQITDPNANTLIGWDDTDNAVATITIGTGLTYTHSTHTLSASGGGLASTDIDTSAEIRAIVGDETGTGALVFAGGNIGAATATSVNGLTITSSTGTLTITNGKTAAISNSLTFTGTDSSSVAFGTGGTVVYTSNNLGALASTTSAQLATVLSDETGSGGGFVRATAPTIDSPVITTKINVPRVTAFPGSPSTGDVVVVTDDSAAGACDSAAGSALTLCYYNGSGWVKLGDGTGAGGSLSSSDIDTSAELRAIVGDETGTGALVFGSSPAIDAPTLSGTALGTYVLGGVPTITPTARSSGAGPYLTVTTPADTGQTASTESIGMNFSAATRTWAAGAISVQRERVFDAPTYAFASASTISTAINADFANPIAGTNATITGGYSIRGGNVLFTGTIRAGSAPTTLTNSAGKIVTSALLSPSGNGGNVATSTGTLTSGNCTAIDANGNFVDSGTTTCGGLTSASIDTSAEIRAIVGDETGTGALVFAGGNIGAATATTASANDNSTAVATTAYVQAELTAYASDTVTETNKTLDAEATGNTITAPFYKDFPAAGCNNATATSFWDLPTSSPAVPTCRTGTNTQKGTLDFADSANLTAQTWFQLPTGWTGNIDANVTWQSTTTSGDVVWQIAIACAGDADSDDPSFTDQAFTADTAKGTANLYNNASKTAITTTGTCAAGDIAHVRIRRDSANAGDTMAGTARLVNVQIVYRVAM